MAEAGVENKIETYIKQQPEWFENIILGCAIKDADFYRKIQPILCKDLSGKGEQDDFSQLLRNAVYRAVDIYNSAQLNYPDRPFVPINEAVMQVMLTNKSHDGEDILADEIPQALYFFRQALELDALRWRPVADMGFVPWIQAQKTQQAVRSSAAFGGWCLHSLKSLLEQVDQKTAGLSGDRTERHAFGHFVDNVKVDLSPDARVLETNLKGLNEALGGGFGLGESNLIISPSSGGKTVLACQLAGDWMCKGIDGILVTTEQPQEDLELRMISNFAQIPFDMIVRGFDPEKLPENYKYQYDRFRNSVKGILEFVDWTSPGHAVSELREEVIRFKDKYKRDPKYIILDWVGGALSEGRGDPGEIRWLFKDAMDQVRYVAQEFNTSAIALAQATQATSINKKVLDHRNIGEAKNMIEGITSFVGLTALYDDRMDNAVEGDDVMWAEQQYLCVSKARKGKGGRPGVRRRYEYQRLENW